MYLLANGVNKRNAEGHISLVEITPWDFDDEYENRCANGERLPYRQLRDGRYAFASKAEFGAAVAALKMAGFLL